MLKFEQTEYSSTQQSKISKVSRNLIIAGLVICAVAVGVACMYLIAKIPEWAAIPFNGLFK